MSSVANASGLLEMPTTDPAPQARDVEDALDLRLMERVATGDEQAFRQLVERHQGAVVGTIARMIGDAAEAEDIAQRAFLRVWQHARRWKPDAKFTTYLFTIVRNLVYNESRRRSRRKLLSVEEHREAHGFDPGENERCGPDAAALKAELVREIDATLSELPENQRTAVVLYAYESLPYEEIAAVLGTSVSSVKSLLFRARTTLRGKLSQHLGY